jgi:protein-L-isoaspartate O-methyltransferase
MSGSGALSAGEVVAGFLLYGAILGTLLVGKFWKTASVRRTRQETLLIAPLAYIVALPILMLLTHGTNEFLDAHLTAYLIQEGAALVVLLVATNLYAKECGLETGKLMHNLVSPLSIAFIVRLFWIIVMETRHIRRFGTTLPQLRIEYVVLVSIPLLVALFILTLRQNRLGYQLSIITGLTHIVLVLSLVVMGVNPGGGPIIVILSSLGICLFSIKGLVDYNAKLGLKPPKIAYFFMRNILRLRKNPEKYRHVLEQAGVKENMTILDYGCGIGSYTVEAAKLIGTTGNVVAADVNEGMLQEVRKTMQANKLTNIQPLRITAPEDVPMNNFDLIFLIDVLHLMQEPLQVIEMMRQKLTATGKLLIKFEHFGKQQTQQLLSMIACSNTRVINEKYWLFSK